MITGDGDNYIFIPSSVIYNVQVAADANLSHTPVSKTDKFTLHRITFSLTTSLVCCKFLRLLLKRMVTPDNE